MPIPTATGLAAFLPDAAWSGLVALGAPVRFRRGQILFDQGDVGRHVYAILEGTAKVVRCESDGSQAMLTIRSAGDVVGDMAALDEHPRSATVTALTSVLARALTAEQFRQYISSPGIAGAFAQYTVARLREADEQRTELALLPVRARLARCLLRLAVAAPHNPRLLAVFLPQVGLAQLTGASRNAIVAELTALRAARVITTNRGVVLIENADALRAFGAVN